MKTPRIPHNESERQQELDSYNILDSLPEKDFDDLTKLAAQICGTPISLVSLIDRDRQWFKSAHGLDETETPRKFAFCAHAINQPDEVFMVEDAREHPDFKENPLVHDGPNVVFYAGAPLVNDKGHGIGTLCVIDNQPKTLSPQQIESLKILARQVVTQLNIKKQNRELLSTIFNLEMAQLKLDLKNQEVEQIVYVASHDLQEPLRTIMSMADILVEDYGKHLDDDGKQFLSYMKDASYRMKELIKHLLEYARLGKGAEFESIELPVLLDDLIKDMKEPIEASGANISFENDLPTSIRGFSIGIRQLFQNLLSNAIKFKKQDVSPDIRIAYQDLGKYHQFSIKDNGIGIPEKYQEKIFIIFRRLHGHDKYEGMGIGLANCKRIVELHQGTLTVQSEEGKGSQFIFTLKKLQ